MTITIPKDYEGRLLRSYLTLTLGLSKAALCKLKNHPQGMLVNGQRVTVRYVLHEGDVLQLAVTDSPDTAKSSVSPQNLPLEILYEDDHVIALNKPPFMPTHPSHGHLNDTLANALAYRYQTLGLPFVFRPLGRLDRNTSGVVVAGKHSAASGALGNALLAGLVKKRYVAILDGLLDPTQNPFCRKEASLDNSKSDSNSNSNSDIYTLETFVHRPDNAGIRREVCPKNTPNAEIAITRFRILAISKDQKLTLVLCEPVTGRTHQLRVHFAYLNTPILGDDIYGIPSPLIPRHALHARTISVPIPFAQTSPTPHDPSLDITTAQQNAVDEFGILHTYAPLPQDMMRVLSERFDVVLS